MNFYKQLAVPAICLILSACVSDTEDNSAETDAAAVNHAAAQLKSRQDAAESLTGGLLNGAIGKRMDNTDKTQFVQAVSGGKVTEWRNAHTGAQFAVHPAPGRKGPRGGSCRDFTIKAIVDGKRQKIYGSACQNNGVWRALAN